MPVKPRRLTRLLTCAALATASATAAMAERGTAPEPRARDDGRIRVAVLDDVFFGRMRAETTVEAKRQDPEAVRQVIEAYSRGEVGEAERLRGMLKAPGAQALVDWVAIRSGAAVGFERIAAFLRDYPDWPQTTMLRRRAELALLSNRRSPAVVRAYFATQRPISAPGKIALALAFKAEGLERDQAALVRDAWRTDVFGKDLEERILDQFPGVLTQADHRFRMERLLFKENWSGAQRAAARAGKDYATLVKARMAVDAKAGNAAKLLDAVPPSLRSDTSYLFSKAQHLRRKEQHREAARLVANVPRDPGVLADGDAWWTERRLIARELLDLGEARTAYETARNHAAEGNAQKIEAEFHAGWIALRFLSEPETARRHFDVAATIAETPISVARAHYWIGRAAEASENGEEARRAYARAADYPITYYGQLAQEKLGRRTVMLRSPDTEADRREAFLETTPARALKLLYQASYTELALQLATELAQKIDDKAHLHALGDLVVEQRDARALLAVGKSAVQRGFPLDAHAYPTIGIPTFDVVGDRVEKAMVYAIARQESAFNPKAQSHAGARGLMQLMPATAKRTAQRFGVSFNLDRLIQDASYNAKLGAAHLGELAGDWRGSHLLMFASYNAGGGNVKKWIDAYGDPRREGVDVVDWVERIPFSETRNYVQRVTENLNVYRSRLEERTAGTPDLAIRRTSSAE